MNQSVSESINMRLFVAIRFTDTFKKALSRVMQELKIQGAQGNFTPVERLHLTLCFIGETEKLSEIKIALQGISFSPFMLQLSEIGRFRDLLWIGTDENPLLNQLVQEIRTALAKTGIPFDRKTFKTHITLVRRADEQIFKKAERLQIPQADMQVAFISLMNSSHINGKLTYTELLRIPANS
ncbi:MAG: RNA 2',3'-cyclic phosphodiesterase [Bacillota bacterium]|nr:RNA 2',3'-cyclic phosphodiesterase [Bacillota bacterium]